MKFTEILTSLGIDFRSTGHEHCRPGWIQLDCPNCSPGWQHFRLGYCIAGNYMNCWGCGPKRVVKTLMELGNVGFKQVSGLLGDLVHETNVPVTDVRGKLRLPDGVGKLLPAHRRYLRGTRGFRNVGKLVKLWGVQGIGVAPKLAWRIFIPIHYRGETVSWTTRAISDDHKLRYRSADATDEKMNHKDLLYGEDYVRHTVIICEGPLGVWKIGPGAVCTFGTGFRRAQVARLAKYPVRVVCFDSDAPGKRRAVELCDLLAPFDGDTFRVELESGKDAGSASRKEIKQLRAKFL